MNFQPAPVDGIREIKRLAEIVREHKPALLEAAAYDAGFPVKITALETDLAVRHLESMEEEIPLVENGKAYGTVAAIFPYDAPVIMLARLGGGALLTGNRLRFSFSSMTPRSAEVLAEICQSFPTFEPVLGKDNREFGQNCIADEAVRVLFISGSSAVGEAYRRHHQSFDKLFFAGPGGMPAAVVFADADPDLASRFIARRAFINGGQYCTTLKKALIHRSHYESIRDQVLEQVRQLKVGDPFDPDTDIGPIRVERTRRIVENALQQFSSSKRLMGSMEGEWVTPFVLETEAIPDLELFGPFLALKAFDDPREAVQETIKTRYGFLTAYFGTPPQGGASLLDEHFGMVHDNPEFYFTPLRNPFGGKKGSGWILERQGGQWVQRDGGFLYSKELVRRA